MIVKFYEDLLSHFFVSYAMKIPLVYLDFLFLATLTSQSLLSSSLRWVEGLSC